MKGGGIWSVTLGKTLHRLAGKVASRCFSVRMGKLVRPQQIGFGNERQSGGSLHATGAFISVRILKSQIILKLDLTNAFYIVHRDKLLEDVRPCCRITMPLCGRCIDVQATLYSAISSCLLQVESNKVIYWVRYCFAWLL